LYQLFPSAPEIVPVESNLLIVSFDPIAADLKQVQNADMNRKEKIEAMLAEDPSDQFLRYSLAMELRREGDHGASLKLLGELMQADPPMVAAYFMAAQQHVDVGDFDRARELLQSGIDQAHQQNDQHAAAEMNELLISLGELGEEL